MNANNFLTHILQIPEEIRFSLLPLPKNQESENDWDQMGTLEVVWSNPPCLSRATWSWLSGTMSRWLLTSSEGGDFSISLGKLLDDASSWSPSQWINFSSCSDGISCVSHCSECLLKDYERRINLRPLWLFLLGFDFFFF